MSRSLNIVVRNLDKTGYTASTVSDKTGYSLTAGSYVVRASSSQRGVVNLPTDTGSANLTISSVTTTRASQAGTTRGSDAGGDAGRIMCTTQITSATTVQAVRNVATSAAADAASEVWELF